MENIFKTVNSLKVPHPFRDVVVTIGGFIGLLLIYFNFKNSFDFSYFSNFYYLNRIEIDIIVLIFSFTFGRLSFLLFNFLESFLFFTLKLIKCIFYKKHKIRSFLNDFYHTNLIRNRGVNLSESKDKVTIIDVQSVVREYPELYLNIERKIHHKFFVQTLLPTSLIISFFNNFYYLILSLFLIISYLRLRNEIDSEYREIYKGVLKFLHQNKN